MLRTLEDDESDEESRTDDGNVAVPFVASVRDGEVEDM